MSGAVIADLLRQLASGTYSGKSFLLTAGAEMLSGPRGIAHREGSAPTSCGERPIRPAARSPYMGRPLALRLSSCGP